MRPFVLPYN